MQGKTMKIIYTYVCVWRARACAVCCCFCNGINYVYGSVIYMSIHLYLKILLLFWFKII